MKARLNLITAGTTTFRYLAFAGAAGGILGIIAAPAESVALVVLALAVCGLMAALTLIIFAVSRPHMTGHLPKLGRPTGTHAKILLVAVLLPLSEGWSFGFFFFVSIGLILSGLTVLVGLAHADLFGRNGKIRVDLKSQTATVATRDGYRATYRLSDGARLGGA